MATCLSLHSKGHIITDIARRHIIYPIPCRGKVAIWDLFSTPKDAPSLGCPASVACLTTHNQDHATTPPRFIFASINLYSSTNYVMLHCFGGGYEQMSTQPRLGTNGRQYKYTTKVQLDESTNLMGFLTEACVWDDLQKQK